jgi:hypothetical protein
VQILPRVAAKFANITVSITLANGDPVTVNGIDVAIVPAGTAPTATTIWVGSHWTPPDATVLLIGPAATVTAPPDYSLTVPAVGGDLWARIVDSPETDVALIDHIELE